MNPQSSPFRLSCGRDRAVAMVAAAATSSSLFVALLVCVDTTSPDRWLTPSPALMESMANCDRHTARQWRAHCKQQVVSAHRSRERQTIQLTQR